MIYIPILKRIHFNVYKCDYCGKLITLTDVEIDKLFDK